jgi:chromosome segregation protein
MYLKRIELLGFKSFPDKTVIKLTSGVTSIVGPNGCGKTNILDAMRWVLGEQKISLLRGTKMEEVIFNGTKELKPLGMAEVTLVIQNTKGRLPTEYSEVQITRRLFRSGESEYLINKVPCRLKDISELLMDTGVGAHVYSMIQQDMVDAILSDRTDDRRFLFEEAAGISKYKSRKKAALRKIETTEQDLLRLKDIVAEVTTQVNSLRRQVRKAERYQKYSNELKEWDIFLAKNSLADLRNERRELLSRKTATSDKKLELDTKIDSLSAGIEENRKKLTELDNELSGLSSQIYDRSESAHTIEKEISILGEKKDNARILKEKNNREIEALKKRDENIREQIEESGNDLRETENELSLLEIEVENTRQTSSVCDEKVLEARRARDELNSRLMSLESRLSAGKSDDSNLREQESDIDLRLSEINTQLESIEKKKSDHIGHNETLTGKLKQMQSDAEKLRIEQNNCEMEIESLDSDLNEITAMIFDLSVSLEAAEARRRLLVDMVAHYEGFSSGAIATINNRDQWPGLIGSLADCLTPDDGFVYALEAALGELAGYMVCRDRNTVNDIIKYLRNEQKGRAGFLILEEAGPDGDLSRPDLPDDAFIGWADNYVSATDELKPLVRMLLSRVAIIKENQGSRIRQMLPAYFSAVTVEGELFKNRVVISGGSSDEIALLGRKERISEQEKIVSNLKNEIEQLNKKKNGFVQSIGFKQAELKSNIENLASVSTDVTRLQDDRRNLIEKRDSLKSRQYDLNLNYDQLVKTRNELSEELAKLDTNIGLFEVDAEGAEKNLSGAQIDQVEKRSKKQQQESQIRHLRELNAEIATTIETKSAEITIAEDSARQASERIIILEQELKSVFESRETIAEEKSTIQERRGILLENIEKKEKDIKNTRQERDDIGSRIHNVEIRLTELESELRNCINRITEEYSIDLDQIEAEMPDSTIPEDQRTERIRILKESIKNMGAVNLLALEEFKTAQERQEFLSVQLNDLLKARSTLESTITKINSTARSLFQETFVQVRENFQKVFEELFTGGESDLILTDPHEPLESPIEIIARPRGKKLLSITQMSGGERALTAISLLFAIYLAKPSPFCVLDEIDAPLDDANINRFLKLIKAFSDQTQFIIITHNKLTMEAADILYGITMEKPGVSRVVSVRFTDEEDGQIIDTGVGDVSFPDRLEIPDSIVSRIAAKSVIKESEPEDNPAGE